MLQPILLERGRRDLVTEQQQWNHTERHKRGKVLSTFVFFFWPPHSQGDQLWDFFGRNDAKAEAPVLCPPDGKSQLIRKDPEAGKDQRWEEKGMTEDEMVGWHH